MHSIVIICKHLVGRKGKVCTMGVHLCANLSREEYNSNLFFEVAVNLESVDLKSHVEPQRTRTSDTKTKSIRIRPLSVSQLLT